MPRPRSTHPGPAALLVAAGAVMGLAGCEGPRAATCRVHADCASGECLPDGRCGGLGPTQDAAPDGAGGDAEPEAGPWDGAADGSADAGPEDAPAPDARADGGDGGAVPAHCVPNDDGVIERREVPLAPGLRARFEVAVGVDVDVAGTDLGDGRRRWDLSATLPGDQSLPFGTESPAGTWFAASFPTATFTGLLSATDERLGVYRATDDALALLGVVSPDDGAARTNLAYDPPPSLLTFPLARENEWGTHTFGSGLYEGLVAAWTEQYAQTVDGAGELRTPYGTFEVLRVHTALTRTVGFYTTELHSFAFVAECFGTVATVVSEEGASSDFTRAAEVRRLTL